MNALNEFLLQKFNNNQNLLLKVCQMPMLRQWTNPDYSQHTYRVVLEEYGININLFNKINLLMFAPNPYAN